MSEIEERRIHLAEKPAERSENFRRMGLGFGESGARKKGEKPDEASGTVLELDVGEVMALEAGNYAR